MLYVSSVAHCSAGGLDLFVCWLIFLYFLCVLSCMFLHGVCSITEGGGVPGTWYVSYRKNIHHVLGTRGYGGTVPRLLPDFILLCLPRPLVVMAKLTYLRSQLHTWI